MCLSSDAVEEVARGMAMALHARIANRVTEVNDQQMYLVID
jgi:hypothetical protein